MYSVHVVKLVQIRRLAFGGATNHRCARLIETVDAIHRSLAINPLLRLECDVFVIGAYLWVSLNVES
jgi:hypothetical protein